MSELYKKIFNMTANAHADNQFYSQAACDYFQAQSDKIVDIQQAISATGEFSFRQTTIPGKQITVTMPTLLQFKNYYYGNPQSESEVPNNGFSGLVNFFKDKSREDIRNGKFLKGLFSERDLMINANVNLIPEWRELALSHNNGVMPEICVQATELDPLSLAVTMAIMQIRYDHPNCKVEWNTKRMGNESAYWLNYNAKISGDLNYQDLFWPSDVNYPSEFEVNPQRSYDESSSIQPITLVVTTIDPQEKPRYVQVMKVGDENNFEEFKQKFDTIYRGVSDDFTNGVPFLGPVFDSFLTGDINNPVLLNDGMPLTMFDILLGLGKRILDENNLVSINEAGDQIKYYKPTLNEVENYLINKKVEPKMFMVDNEYYTTSTDIAMAYILNNDDYQFVDGDVISTDNEDELLVKCYKFKNHNEVVTKSMCEIRDALVQDAVTKSAFAQMLSVYDENKTPGENLQMMLASAEAKGLPLTEDSSNLLDIVRTNQGIDVKTLFANILDLNTPEIDNSSADTALQPSKLEEYTGSASVMSSIGSASEFMSDRFGKALSGAKKIANNLWEMAKSGIKKIKNKASDYLGIENMPFSSIGEGDDTIDNGCTIFYMTGREILADWRKIFIIPWDFNSQSTTNPWYDITLDYLNNKPGLKNYFKDFSAAKTLSELFGETNTYNVPVNVTYLMDNLYDRSPQIMHVSAVCADIYLQCSDKDSSSKFLSKYKIMIKWKPTINGPLFNELQIPSNKLTVSDVIAYWFNTTANKRPVDLSHAAASECKRWVENAKHYFWWSILFPLYMENVAGEDLSAIADNTALNRLSVATLLLTTNRNVNNGNVSFNSSQWDKPFWMFEHPDNIVDTAVTNQIMMQCATKMGKCHSDNDGYIRNNQTSITDYDNAVVLFTPWSAKIVRYFPKNLTNEGKWKEILATDYNANIFSNIAAMLVIGYVAKMVESNDEFIPYVWTDSITKGRFFIQNDQQEANELTVGLSTAILVGAAVIIGGTVATKKLVSLTSLKKSSRNLNNLEWQRADLACQQRNLDYAIDDAKRALDGGTMTQTAYNSILQDCTSKKSVIESRYKDVVKQERKANRLVRRLTRWSTAKSTMVNSAVNKITSNSGASDISLLSASQLPTRIGSVENSVMDCQDQVKFIKDRI